MTRRRSANQCDRPAPQHTAAISLPTDPAPARLDEDQRAQRRQRAAARARARRHTQDHPPITITPAPATKTTRAKRPWCGRCASPHRRYEIDEHSGAITDRPCHCNPALLRPAPRTDRT